MPQWDVRDTICAIASGSSPALRGIIRVSGPDAVACCAKLVADELRSAVLELKQATRVEALVKLERLDQSVPCSLLVWPDSRSYTGQPSVEINVVGSQIILQLLVEKLCALGTRPAQPGEFTYRAFLNGRLDLTQCEAVLAVIHATGEASLRTSLQQLSGGLSEPLAAVRKSLVNLLADLEAGLDFVDEDIEFVSRHQVEANLTSVLAILEEVHQKLGSRRHVANKPKIVLVGLPNAGKSSLANALLGSNHAIVSDVAGTTRDFLRCPLQLRSGEVDLIDTAGFEAILEDLTNSSSAGQNQISLAAQQMMRERWNESDLVLFCCENSDDSDAFNKAVHAFQVIQATLDDHSSSRECWLIRTKSDRGPLVDLIPNTTEFSSVHSTSASTRAGIDDLLLAIDAWYLSRSGAASDVVPMTLVRCAAAIESACSSLQAALDVCRCDAGGDELIAAELRNSLHELGTVVGEVYTDDILDALFSRFCIGK